MIPESSPFTPGSPASAESFVGREAEIERVQGLVRAARRGRVRVGFVSGERGIGKSSLAGFVRRLAERRDDVVGCHVYLGGVQDLAGMLQRTLDRLLKDSIGRPWHRQMLDSLGARVRSVGLFGATLELRLSNDDIGVVERNFAYSVREFLKKTGKDKSLLLILDDFNGLAGSAHFANWLKSTVDEIATSSQTTRLCMLMVGLEERRRELIEQQPSLARVFELVDVVPWSDEEVAKFYQRSFKSADAVLSSRSVRALVEFTGGLPVLAHEIGDAVWRSATGPMITRLDIAQGTGLAARAVGAKYLEPRILAAIRSERYRSILDQIVQGPRIQFTRAEALRRLSNDDRRALDNFLRRMTKLGGLEAVPEVRGGYRFPNRLSQLYFRMAATTASDIAFA